ncbi:MAG TPA: carboxypeptidase-like regulatory domain-containing protein [Bacteroidales bacterium]|nr:carboxypeptidase-like regulatory domain-containing protein [Bacteroidales bacterium]
MKKIVVFCIAALIGMQISFAQTTITGKVTSKKDGKAVSGAQIKAKAAADIVVMTDFNGNYQITVPSDIKVLEVNAVGYSTKTEGIGQKKVIDFVLTPASKKSKTLVKSKPVQMKTPESDKSKTTK